MERLLLIGIIVLMAFKAFAQSDTLNQMNESNQKQGYWIIYDDNKVKVEEGRYENGQKAGIWKAYYEDGKIKHEITFKANKPDGYAKFYYPSGIVSEEGIWKGNKWVGEYKYYHTNGNKAYDWSYNEQGKRTGEQKYYHANGQLMIEGEWKDGKEAGVVKEYDETGKLIAEKSYENGKLDETSVKIYNSEKPKENTDTNEDLTHPNNITNQSDQNANNDVGYFNGNGHHVTYTKDRKVEREGEWKNGKLVDGKRYYYDETGKLIKTTVYRNGNVVNIIYPD